jgi:hypothetical protein
MITNAQEALGDALRLCRYNTPSFPCRVCPAVCMSNKCGICKTPACPHGFKDATVDPDKLQELWRQFPGPLVGVPTGKASGIFVIDVDSGRHDEASDWLERNSPYLPETRQHATTSGGWHLLFKHRPGLWNSASKLAKGVDTRGDGGYIIWWPFHMGISAPHKLLPPAELPDEIFERLIEPLPPIREISRTPTFGKSVGKPSAKVQGILNAVAAAQEGERNILLFWGACRISDMIAAREIGSAEGANAFAALNLVSIGLGLPAREIARTVRSAMR